MVKSGGRKLHKTYWGREREMRSPEKASANTGGNTERDTGYFAGGPGIGYYTYLGEGGGKGCLQGGAKPTGRAYPGKKAQSKSS